MTKSDFTQLIVAAMRIIPAPVRHVGQDFNEGTLKQWRRDVWTLAIEMEDAIDKKFF